MHNRKKRLIAALLAVTVCLTQFTGCSSKEVSNKAVSGEEVVEITPMEPEESRAPGVSAIGGKDVMPISGGKIFRISVTSKDGNVFPESITQERLQMFKDAGIKLFACDGADYNSRPELVMQLLDMAEENGMGFCVEDSGLLEMVTKEQLDVDAILERLANYVNHPAFYGIQLVDEPNTAYYMPAHGDKHISKYAPIAEVFRKYNIAAFNCLLPAYNIDEEGVLEKYERYIKEYIETFQPKVFTYDNYLFSNSGVAVENYLWNMSVIRDISDSYEVAWGVTLQAGGQWNDAKVEFDSIEYYPNEGQYYWNANISLAMGAQWISIFPGMQPEHFAIAKTEKWDFYRNGLLSAAGNKTQWYYYAQNINKHIEVIDEVLLNSVNKGVIVSGEQAKEEAKHVDCIIESGKFQELMSVNGDAFIGCFNYQGKTALYVVNYSMEYAQKIDLGFNKAQNIKMVQGAEVSYVNAKNLTLDMAAGEGALLVIE